MAKYNSIAIARFFLERANEEGRHITNMKIFKMIYFAQGFYLAENNKSLIEDEIQAWKYGPVIPEVYEKLKRFGSSTIIIDTEDLPKINSEDTEVIEFLQSLYLQISKYSDNELSEFIHASPSPWYDAYKRHQNSVITNDEMIKYFKTIIKQ